MKYDENIEEETKQRSSSSEPEKGLDKSLDLMRKLTDYLGY